MVVATLLVALGQCQPVTIQPSPTYYQQAATQPETLGPAETVWIPSYNANCKGQRILSGPLTGQYRILEVLTAPTAAAPTAAHGDPYGFITWLNSTRAAYGLAPVSYDPNLTNWAALNNNSQLAYGLGHFVMGPARRQNAAMGSGFPGAMWMASPGHRAALLDPTITWFGIAAAGAYWTFNAR